MDLLLDIHETARAFFLVKIVNGAVPEMVKGGPFDGLRYFAVELGDEQCWLTNEGLVESSMVTNRNSATE